MTPPPRVNRIFLLVLGRVKVQQRIGPGRCGPSPQRAMGAQLGKVGLRSFCRAGLGGQPVAQHSRRVALRPAYIRWPGGAPVSAAMRVPMIGPRAPSFWGDVLGTRKSGAPHREFFGGV